MSPCDIAPCTDQSPWRPADEPSDTWATPRASRVEMSCSGCRTLLGQQVQLSGEPEVGEQRCGGTSGRRHGPPEERPLKTCAAVGFDDDALDGFLQHAARQMAQAPRELAVIVIGLMFHRRRIWRGVRLRDEGACAHSRGEDLGFCVRSVSWARGRSVPA